MKRKKINVKSKREKDIFGNPRVSFCSKTQIGKDI